MTRTPFAVTTDDGATLAASREGTGPTLCLVSGLGGTAAFWDPVAAALAASFTVVRFDQRGIGASTRGTASVDIARLATDVLAVLAETDGAAVLVGHSTGGAILQSLAATAPERVASLVLSGTWHRPSRYMATLFATRLRLLDLDPAAYAASSAVIAFAPAWLEDHPEAVDAAAAKAPATPAAVAVVRERIAAILAFDGRPLLPRIAAPALVVGAADDVIVPSFLQRELAEALPARLAMLPEGGHFFPVSRSRTFAEIVREFAAETR